MGRIVDLFMSCNPFKACHRKCAVRSAALQAGRVLELERCDVTRSCCAIRAWTCWWTTTLWLSLMRTSSLSRTSWCARCCTLLLQALKANMHIYAVGSLFCTLPGPPSQALQVQYPHIMLVESDA